MKILVVSLLRLGDVILTAPIIQGLSKKYPNAQIDLLINKQFEKVKFLFPEINEFHFFDRQTLQDALVHPHRPILESFDRLKLFMKSISGGQYDLVINLTQNRLSGHLMDLIDAKEKIGMLIKQPAGEVSFGSTWFKYVNDIAAAGAKSIFHYTDAFRFACAVEQNGYRFNPTSKQNVKPNGVQKILIQTQTSDAKKNMDLSILQEAMALYAKAHKNVCYRILSAKGESGPVLSLVENLKNQNIDAEIAELDLPEVLSECFSSNLLVTTDTSIKHLAAGTSIPILEIALGSSDPRKTGVYKEGSYIIQSREQCVPCDHRKVCHRSSHVCAEQIPAEFLAAMFQIAMHDDRLGAATLADEYSDQVEVMRTHFSKTGFWRADALRSTARPKVLEEWLDLAAWRFFLDKDHTKNLAPYGTESFKMKEMFDRGLVYGDRNSLRIALEQIEQTTTRSEEKVHHLISEISRRVRSGVALPHVDFVDDHMLNEIRSVELEMDLGDSVSSRVIHARGAGIRSIRLVQNALNEIFNHQQIKLKLVRTLKTQMTEYI